MLLSGARRLSVTGTKLQQELATRGMGFDRHLRGNNPQDRMSALGGEFNESTQHLLILADEEVWEWRGMHGHGSRRNRRLSCGSAGRAVNVWRTSRERLRGGTRAASIGSWLAMEGLLQRHAGGLWERCGLRSAKRFREALPPVGRY